MPLAPLADTGLYVLTLDDHSCLLYALCFSIVFIASIQLVPMTTSHTEGPLNETAVLICRAATTERACFIAYSILDGYSTTTVSFIG